MKYPGHYTLREIERIEGRIEEFALSEEEKSVSRAQFRYRASIVEASWRNDFGDISDKKAIIMFGLTKEEYDQITSGNPRDNASQDWADRLLEMARMRENPTAHERMRFEARLAAGNREGGA